MTRFLVSLLLGTALAFALFWGGYFAVEADRYELSYALYWQAWALQKSLPCWTMAAAGTPLCEDLATAKFMFYAGLPLGVILYTGAFYGLFAWRARRKARAGVVAATPVHPPRAGATGSDTA